MAHKSLVFFIHKIPLTFSKNSFILKVQGGSLIGKLFAMKNAPFEKKYIDKLILLNREINFLYNLESFEARGFFNTKYFNWGDKGRSNPKTITKKLTKVFKD